MDYSPYFRPQHYPDLLHKIHMSSKNMESSIKDYELNFPQIRNKEVEYGIRFPVFVEPFYEFILENNRIPQQKEYYDFYMNRNSSFFSENTFGEKILEGLRARIFRTYPSLVRDLHFNLFLREKLAGEYICYNIKLDINEGIDFIIKYNGIYYGINLYTKTKNSLIARTKKEKRHSTFSNIVYLDLPIVFGEPNCGPFFLYGYEEYKRLLLLISGK